MIINDFIKFATNNEINKGLNKQPRNNEVKKGEKFEDILSSTKAVSTFSSHNKKSNFKSNSVKSQNYNEKRTNFREDTFKENAMEEQSKKSDFALDNQTESNKTMESKKLGESSNNENDLDNANEDIDVDNTYNYSIILMTGLTNTDEAKLVEDLNMESEQNYESNTLLKDLAVDTDMITSNDNMILDQSSVDLTGFDETDNSMVFDLNLEQNQAPKQERGSKSFIEEEPIDLQSLNTEELETYNLNFNIKNNKDEKQTEEQKTIFIEHIPLDEEEVNFLQNGNKVKALGTNSNLQIEEDLDVETVNGVKAQNIFTNFNDNIHSHLEKSLDNTFRAVVNEKLAVLDKDNIFQQIVEKVKVDLDKTDEIRIKLKPDFLGEISLKISTDKGIVTAKAFVENYSVKQIIESNLDNLKDNMKEMGINFEALDVSVGKDSGFEKNNSQAWKQEQKIKVRKPKLESVPVASAYEDDTNAYVGGLYSSSGNIDLIV